MWGVVGWVVADETEPLALAKRGVGGRTSHVGPASRPTKKDVDESWTARCHGELPEFMRAFLPKLEEVAAWQRANRVT